MTQPNQSEAFQLLQSMAQQGQQLTANLPVQNEVEGQWRGVGFRLAGIDFIAPMPEVDEVLYMPSCTRFPGVKPWVTGVANVRGRLLSVVDLGMFFGNKPSISSKKCRVLAARHNDLYTGVIVEEVLGIQTLGVDSRIERVATDDLYKPYVTGGFEQDGRSWTIFSLSRLVQAPDFLQVAV